MLLGDRREGLPAVGHAVRRLRVNAIAAFFLSGIFARLLGIIQVPAGPDAATISLKGFIYTRGFTPLFANPANASLAFAISFVLVWLGIMTVMYRRRIFIKV
jgi:predicted acyltransferase